MIFKKDAERDRLKEQGRERKSKQPRKHLETINTQILIALIYFLWNRSSRKLLRS